MLSIGSFASLQAFIRQIAFLAVTVIAIDFGTETLAAYGIGGRLRFFIMVPGFAFASAAAVLVGQNMGAGKPARATRAAWACLMYYEVIAVILGIVFYIAAPRIVSIFPSVTTSISLRSIPAMSIVMTNSVSVS